LIGQFQNLDRQSTSFGQREPETSEIMAQPGASGSRIRVITPRSSTSISTQTWHRVQVPSSRLGWFWSGWWRTRDFRHTGQVAPVQDERRWDCHPPEAREDWDRLNAGLVDCIVVATPLSMTLSWDGIRRPLFPYLESCG
jgi:hypothetical protein